MLAVPTRQDPLHPVKPSTRVNGSQVRAQGARDVSHDFHGVRTHFERQL